MDLKAILFTILACPLASSALTLDVVQQNINGTATASALGFPFGQSFTPTSSKLLLGIYVTVVDDVGAADLLLSLYHSDSLGVALTGAPITTGTLSSAAIHALYEPGTTPLYLPIYFDTPYAEAPGEHLAFTVAGSSLGFHFASGSPYSGGRLLSDAAKDLTFGTIIVPEPTTCALLLSALSFFLRRRGSRQQLARWRA